MESIKELFMMKKYENIKNIEFSYDLFLRPVEYSLNYEIAMSHVISDMYEEGSKEDLAFIETTLTRYGYSEEAYNIAFKRRVNIATYKWYFDRSMGYLLARILIENNCVNEFIEHCLKNYESSIKIAFENHKRIASGTIPKNVVTKLLRGGQDESQAIYHYLYGTKYPDAMVSNFLMDAYILNDLNEEDTRDDYIYTKTGEYYVGKLDTLVSVYGIDCNTDEKWLEFEERIRKKIADKVGCKLEELDSHFLNEYGENEVVDCIYWAQLANSFCPRSWKQAERTVLKVDISIAHKQIRNAIMWHLIKFFEEKYNGGMPKFLHFNKYDFNDEQISSIVDLAVLLIHIAVSDNTVQDMLLKSSIQKHALNSSIVADELERLKDEYKKVVSQNESLKKQNNDLNNKILNRANKEKKGIEKPLLDEIKMLQEELQKQKEEIAQLKQSREIQDELLREVTAEHTVPETDTIDFSKIEVTRFLLVGGRDKITKQVLAKTKFKKIIKDTFSGTVDLSEVEYVIFFFDAMNHALYYKIINLVREKKKKVIYCHGNNIDKIFEQIYSQMK